MTKTRLCLLFAAVLLASSGVSAQKSDLERIKPKTVTLVSHGKHRDYHKSVFNFQHGIRGDKKFPVKRGVVLKNLPDNRGLETHRISVDDVQNPSAPFRRADAPLGGPDAPPDPSQYANRVRYDIRFGGMTVNGTNNWLDIADRRGAQSVIKDLGPMEWAEVKEVPLLPPAPVPYAGGITIRAGRQVGPENVIVRAVVGHMYALHVKDHETDYYVMFRVEEIDPAGACTLSWKRVPSPKG